MEDLDSLLEDLGRGKTNSSSSSSSAAKKPVSRPASSRVDLNELEDLMEDLAAPTAKKTPEPVAASSFMQSTPSSASYSSAPSNPTPSPAPVNNGSSSNSSNNVDDLEALMESLNVASNNRASTRKSAKPATSNATSSTVTPAKSAPPKEDLGAKFSYAPPSGGTTTQPPANSTLANKPAYAPTPASAPVTHINNSSSTPVVKGDDLDKLLNNLTNQMDSIDSENPSSRGTCAACRGSILGEIVQALGRSYHPEHFTCGNCREPLGTKNFYEQNGAPHCQNCFETLFCPKCAYCNGSVMDRCITAIGKKWHPEHFICTQCLKPFPNGNFFERDGRPYCETDFYSVFAPKCGACLEPIKGDCINALGQQWHPEHFVCTYCGKAFQGSFFEFNGKPYCEAHYHQQTGSLCAGCGKPITGRCVNALDKKWHPEHFVCAFCMNPLAGGSFSEKNNKAYCKECHGKLFGS